MNAIRYNFDQWSSQRWINNTRYYDIHVHQDLWGRWVVTRVNGRLNTALGRIVHQPTSHRTAANQLMECLRRRRIKRGYCEDIDYD